MVFDQPVEQWVRKFTHEPLAVILLMAVEYLQFHVIPAIYVIFPTITM